MISKNKFTSLGEIAQLAVKINHATSKQKFHTAQGENHNTKSVTGQGEQLDWGHPFHGRNWIARLMKQNFEPRQVNKICG